MDFVISIAQQVMGYLLTIRITDVLDIAIISYMIYRLLMLAKNSNAGQVMKGLFLLILVMWLANVWNMHILSYFLNNAVEIGLLAIVVVFQPELRHFLEQMGSSERFRVFFGHEEKTGDMEAVINEVVEAYGSMARSKIGALTVFERSSILDDSIKTGTAFDAEVRSELIKNIFWPKAPMHDGALIIRKGRIAGAGCVLPLSGNTSISRELGMRHRAGIGTTEHTDALVVICSEETGSISVATNGMLKRHLAPETLKRLLMNELMPNDNQGENRRATYLLDKLSNLNAESMLSWLRGGEKKEEKDHVE